MKATYFIGIGGIGMSAVARYFNKTGILTCGYDKTPSSLTDSLSKEGINIHFEDDIKLIPKNILDIEKDSLLIIYTPAVPDNHSELRYFINSGYKIHKRSEILGEITNKFKTVAVAGTHGKTSVSTIIAHIFKHSGLNVNAFLGGISKNYNSNLILSDNPENAEFAITEADEFDRSFLQLNPYSTVVTAIDEDHLDIYKDIYDIRQTFEKFINQTDKSGNLLLKEGLKLNKNCFPNNVYTYSLEKDADYYPENIHTDANSSTFELITPTGKIENLKINIPGNMNIENAVAAAAIANIHKIKDELIREALKSWTGVKRRFEYVINTPDLVYIDDYAHHPEELKSLLNSVRDIYKDKKITGIFQPHLYTRTRDFADEFAESLSLLDELILLDIYPAREDPIPGITSKIIFDKVDIKNKILINKDQLLENININDPEILLTIGAGDIDRLVDSVRKLVLKI
ncbi:MAG: UDP-N-acetylmuramate--L-alanine ligase [Bacteroidales bacterium]|nr:UDP-N-acetylmuramate--L-alanine ligase [Bacteroidales bacterium]